MKNRLPAMQVRIRRVTVGQFVILTLVMLAAAYPEWERSRNGYTDLRQEQEQEDSVLVASKARMDTINEEGFRLGSPGVESGVVTRESVAAEDRAWTANWVKIANSHLAALRDEAEIDRMNAYAVALLGAIWVAIAWVWFGRGPDTCDTRERP